MSDPSRSPRQVTKDATDAWVAWQPGDGTRYWVRILPVCDGPDRGDSVLLVSVCGETSAFQYPCVEYRRRERGRLTRGRTRPDIWRAAKPLLQEVGAR